MTRDLFGQKREASPGAPVCPICDLPMVYVKAFEFGADEPFVQRLRQATIDIAGRVTEWACRPCDQREFVWDSPRNRPEDR